MSSNSTFTYDAAKQCCSECGSKDVIIKTSKTGNKPYLVNGNKSYHRTFGKDGQMHCVKSNEEIEWIKTHDSMEGFSQGGGAPGHVATPGESSTSRGGNTSPIPIPLVESLGTLDTVSAVEYYMMATCERFTIMMYPTAMKFAKQIVGPNGDPKDIRICASGIMHDYANIFAILADKKISKKMADQPKPEKIDNGIGEIPDIEEPVHPDDEP